MNLDLTQYCLVSLGGIMNEVLERRRPLEQLVVDDSADKDDVINEQINTSMYSPSRGHNNLLSTVRKSISVSMEDITHYYTSNNICQNETEAIEFIGHLKRYHRSILYHSIVSKDDECEKKDDSSVLLSQPPGMINLGATCYLNSQIQCLAQIINFRQGVLSWNSPSSHQPALLFDPESTSDSVSATTPPLPSSIMNDEQGVPAVGINAAFSNLQLLLAKLEHAPGNTIDTRMLATSLNLLESEMQDPNEFSRLFLDRVMDLCPELKDLLKKLFGGEVRYETKCQSCGMTRYRRETFMELTLALPENVNNKSGKKRSTVKFDVSVQDCLDDYLIPEKLHSENQYECSRCRGKRDAERTLCFASLPPVLQIQLNKYVFDIQRNVKRKRMEEVRLPRELKINVCNHQQENTDQIEEYILCGVLHHLGTSAYGGHYIAEAMDWTTGTWFEFNDKDVKILPDGPTGSYFLENDKGRKIKGSADAYSMFYVEKGHLAKMVQNEFNERNCSSSSVVDIHKHTNCAIVDQIIKERITEYEKITKLQDENLSHASKMKERREKVLTNMFPSSVPLFIDPTSPNLKWVDGVKLRDFLSYSVGVGGGNSSSFCSPIDVTGTDNSSPSSDKKKILLSHSHFLCEHGKKGLHPRVARKGKILSEEMYQKYLSILSEEYYKNEESENVVGFEFTDKMIDPSCDIYCEECASSYQKELREKFTILTTSLEIFDNLQESTTSATEEDGRGENERRFAVAAKFVTDLKRYMMKKFNLVLKDKSVQAEGIDKIFFSELIYADKVMETGGEPIADPFVNKRIICPHGKLKQTNNKRTTKIVSEETWNNILSLFPNAISAECLEDGNSSSSDSSPPICEECIKESELERMKQENAAAERKANRKTNAAKQTKQLSNKKETTNDQTNDLIVEILDMVDLTIYQLDATVDVHDMACSEAKQIVSHLIANQGLFHHRSTSASSSGSAVGHSSHSFAAPMRRRSTRKRKSQGHSSFYKVRFKRTQNLGAVRLMLYEQHNKSPLNQALFLAVLYTPESGTFYNMDENMYESSPPPYKIIELPFMWNDRSFEDILLDSQVRDGHNPRGFSDEVGVNNNLDLMYSSVWLYLKYDDEASEFVDGGGKMSKQEREEIEESILNSLLIYDDQSTSSSKDGTSNSNNKKRGRKRRAEKGFSGTALESCIPPSKRNNIVEIDVDSNNAETATIPVSEQDELKSSEIKRGSVFEPIEVEN